MRDTPLRQLLDTGVISPNLGPIFYPIFGTSYPTKLYLTIQGGIVDDELRPDLADLLAFQERQEPAQVLQVQRVRHPEVGVGVGRGGGGSVGTVLRGY